MEILPGRSQTIWAIVPTESDLSGRSSQAIGAIIILPRRQHLYIFSFLPLSYHCGNKQVGKQQN